MKYHFSKIYDGMIISIDERKIRVYVQRRKGFTKEKKKIEDKK